MENIGDKVAFIWSVADLLRDAFKRSKYPDVILPLTVLRRLDCVLEPTKDRVLEAHAVRFGSTLGNDEHADKRFDYLFANPPFGKEWKMDREKIKAERGYAGRFGAGLPRISDGQLLFLQHMLCRMKDAREGGSRVAIVMNGSPLFTGDAGSGESEIRRWILENDWLEAIVALPEPGPRIDRRIRSAHCHDS